MKGNTLTEVHSRNVLEIFPTGGKLTEEAATFPVQPLQFVKDILHNEYQKEEEPGKIIWQALKATLDNNTLINSIKEMDVMYKNTPFNEEKQFLMMRSATIKANNLEFYMARFNFPNAFWFSYSQPKNTSYK